ncbi:MAG: hypothetical protein JW874_06700 [Spirochaetales bacterium]|nr:hypothetical protein [Spirochaetales bacterium]
MNLFLILSVPASLVLATIFLFREKVPQSDLWAPFLRGVLVALAGTAVLLIIHSSFKWTFSGANIYLYCFLFYAFFPLLIAQAAFLLFTLFLQYKPLKNPEFQYTSYLSGYFFILSFSMFLIRSSAIDSYLLFYQPFFHLAVIAAVPVVSLYILDMYSGLSGYILFCLTPLTAFFFALVPFFYYINLAFISFIILVLILGGSATLFMFLRKKY